MKTGSAILLTTILLFTTAAAAPPPEEGDFTPAVVLFKPGLETPLETAGTGLSPEVSVQVQVDGRGVVTEVQVLKIEPSSEYDDLFRTAVLETVARWRYAPARENGVAVPTELKWSVRFPARIGQAGSEDEPRGFHLSGFVTQDREALQRRILALPTEQRIKMLEDEANLAVTFLDQETLKKVNTRRFTVFSDAPTSEIPEIVAGNLEAIFNILGDFLGPKIDPKKERYKIIVILFDSSKQFDEYKSASKAMEWASGFYHPAGLIAMHRQVPHGGMILSTLLHEGTHAYLDRHVVRPGFRIPQWLNEGFAEYIGNSEIKKKKLVPGKTIRDQLYNSRYGLLQGESVQHVTVQMVKDAVRKGEALSVVDLIEADVARFYGEQRGMFYPMSWLMVHFLQHGREDWNRAMFVDYMLYVAEGYPARDALATVYGVTPVTMEDEYRRYIRKF